MVVMGMRAIRENRNKIRKAIYGSREVFTANVGVFGVQSVFVSFTKRPCWSLGRRTHRHRTRVLCVPLLLLIAATT